MERILRNMQQQALPLVVEKPEQVPTKRSQSAPSVRYSPGYEAEAERKESLFLKFGDRISFFSGSEASPGFIGTLG